ncbi:hypothetical protein [Aeromicrobium sp. UC242_57]|uniref:hypothetical protein n=1 Tax=Aeromicrobium sp. UC242_57 TaxID=3374624 RepID=UPI0037984EF9
MASQDSGLHEGVQGQEQCQHPASSDDQGCRSRHELDPSTSRCQQANYYGFSYGTYLGQVYSSMFPNRTRRMVFDGTVDPRGVWYKANLSQDAAFDKNINIWFGWLAKYDKVYGLGNSKAKVRKLVLRHSRRPVPEPGHCFGRQAGGSEWIDSFLYAGYYQSTWTDLAEAFSAYVKKGNVTPLENAYLDSSGYGDDNGYAVYLGVQCTDVAWPKAGRGGRRTTTS